MKFVLGMGSSGHRGLIIATVQEANGVTFKSSTKQWFIVYLLESPP